MTPAHTFFRVGDLYTSLQIQDSLQVGNAGGLRVSLDEQGAVKRMVVLTALPNAKQQGENPYHDRIEGDILIYTGAGRRGDQALAGANRRIPDQSTTRFPIYCFQLVGSRRDRLIGSKRWRFLGLLEYLLHYRENQLDVQQQMRQVWLFEFLIHDQFAEIAVSEDHVLAQQLLASGKSASHRLADDRELGELKGEFGVTEDRETAAQIELERVRLLAMSPIDFEHVIRDALTENGFDQVQVTRYSQDGGIDVNAYAGQHMWPIQRLLVQIQAKRWRHTVGRKEVAELRGSLKPFARGAVVTTSHFSKAAITEAAEPGKNPIVLVDGFSFANIVRMIRSMHSSPTLHTGVMRP